MHPTLRRELTDWLASFVTEHKRELFARVLAERTRHVTVVLEDIFQPHNASAVVRTCDLSGVQDLHVIENRNRYTINPAVTVGASKWVDLHRYNGRGENNTAAAAERLKQSGYRLVATSPHRNEVSLDELPVEEPLALLFGTEESGLTGRALELADEYVTIPQTGFTESYNLSVSVALCLYEVMRRLRASSLDWRLSEEERAELELAWIRKVVKSHEELEARFFAERGLNPEGEG